MRDLLPCGTRAAYIRHRYWGEQPCEACLEANTKYTRKFQPRRVTLGLCSKPGCRETAEVFIEYRDRHRANPRRHALCSNHWASIEEARRLQNEGLSAYRIADVMKTSRSTVRRWLLIEEVS